MIYDVPKPTSEPAGIPPVGGDFPWGAVNGTAGGRELKAEPTVLLDTPPLSCRLYRKEDGSRSVVVSEGRVIEYIPISATGDDPPLPVDGVKEWPISNIWDTELPNLLREHPIETGWSIGVTFNVDRAGYITGDLTTACRITTRDPDGASGDVTSHYDPPVGPSAGAGGTVYVILARLIGTGDDERLLVYHGGSNIEHYHELTPFRLVDGADGEDIFDDFDVVTGDYRYLGVRGKQMDEEIGDKPADTDPKIEVLVQMASVNLVLKRADLVIDWTKGPNLNLIVRGYTLQAATTDVEVTFTVPEQTVTTSYQGGHTHELLPHVHTVYGDVDTGTGYTDSPPHSPAGDFVLTETDGAHSHTITIPEQVITTTISVPSETRVPDTDYYTICFRDRLYHSIVANDVDLPPVIAGTTTQTKTIWVLSVVEA